MKSVKAILFDVDGTLLNSSEFIFQAIEHSIKTHKLDSKTRKYLTSLVGMSLEEVYRSISNLSDVTHLMFTHREFQRNNFHLSTPFPKTINTLKKLKAKGLKLGAVTNRGNPSAQITLEKTSVFEYLDVLITADILTNPKPHPEGINIALEKLQTERREALMVGDSHVDIQAGKNAKVKTVGATYGFGGKEISVYSPDFLIDDISDLIDLLR